MEAEITFYQESTFNHNTVLAIKYTYILIGNFVSFVHTKNIIPHIKIFYLFSECFGCIYVYISCMFLLLTKTRQGHQSL